jgi:hypothetical protein
VSQGNSVTVDVSSRSKCHSGRNVGGCNVKAPHRVVVRVVSVGPYTAIQYSRSALPLQIVSIPTLLYADS